MTHARIDPQDKLRLLFSKQDAGPFGDLKTTIDALQDWRLDWQVSMRTHAQRVLAGGKDPNEYRQPEEAKAPTAILLPGIWEPWENLSNWGRALFALGWDVRFIPELDLQLGSLAELSKILTDYLQKNDLLEVLVVAHSKGGLVTKAAMVSEEGWRIDHLIACGTPFEGAPIAVVPPEIMQTKTLVPGSEELVELSSQTDVNKKITAVQAKWDQNVPANPHLPGAQIVTVDVTGHNALLHAPEVIAQISFFSLQRPNAPLPRNLSSTPVEQQPSTVKAK